MELSDMFAKYKRLDKINEDSKPTTCKYCESPVVFEAVDIVGDQIRWHCLNVRGNEQHNNTCLRKINYVPKFKQGDVLMTSWKKHKTFYKVLKIDMEVAKYYLQYLEANNYASTDTNIPIRAIDEKSTLCDEGMIEAIF